MEFFNKIFFENYNSNKDKDICFICKKNKIFHLDYIPDEVYYSNKSLSFNNNINNNISNNINSLNNNNINNNINDINNNFSFSNNSHISFNYVNIKDSINKYKKNKGPFNALYAMKELKKMKSNQIYFHVGTFVASNAG